MKRRRRRSDRSGRAPLMSPGRPSVAGRDERRRFWVAIAAGTTSEDAAIKVGVSQAVETRWFREAGGMPPSRSDNRRSRSPAGIFRLPSGRRSRSFACRATPCRRSPASSGEQRRRSPGSCGAMLPPGAVAWSIAQQRRNGRRAIRSPSKAGEACAQYGIANLRGGAIAGVVVAPSGALVPGPAVSWKGRRHGQGGIGVGKRLEPGTDPPPPAGRLPGQ